MHAITMMILALMILSGCGQTDHSQNTVWQQFCCRDEGTPSERLALYRAKVPVHWLRQDSEESLVDTTKPICEFFIGEQPDHILLTLHTFPADKFERRIPPEAQINRWKRQFDELDLCNLIIEPCSHGGYTGLLFQGQGSFKGKESSMIGYSMQLAPPHWMILHAKEEVSFKERHTAADYTIKAMGSFTAIEKWKTEIECFADSFELIEELSTR